jgi:hypothetical protein
MAQKVLEILGCRSMPQEVEEQMRDLHTINWHPEEGVARGLSVVCFSFSGWTGEHEPQPPKLHILVTVGDPLGTHWGPIGDPWGTEIWSVQWTAQKAAADGPIQGVRNPVDTQWTPDGPMSRTVWNWNLDSFVDNTMYSLCRYLHGTFIIVYEDDTEWYWTMLTLFFLWAGTDQCQLRGGATCPGRSSGEGFLLCCT